MSDPSVQNDKLLLLIKSLLYELQPIRYVDVVYYWKELSVLLKFIFQLIHEYIIKNIVNLIITFMKDPTTIAKYIREYYSVAIWLIVWYIFVIIEFGQLFFILSIFALIFLNLGERRKGEMSAYSVFNKGFMKLLGTTTAEQFENEILHRNPINDNNNDDDHDNEDNDELDNNNNNNNNPRQPAQQARKKGKKARRNYEERLLRRAEQQQQNNENDLDWEDGN